MLNDPIFWTDPSGLLFGGSINAGESYGDSAAQFWANKMVQTGNPLYMIPGLFASLWTPCTSDDTFAVLSAGNAAGGLLRGLGKGATSKTGGINKAKGFLGQDARVITNKNGDKIFISKNGTRKIRFDINKTKPHENPHGHVEELINGEWKKSGPIFPKGVPKR